MPAIEPLKLFTSVIVYNNEYFKHIFFSGTIIVVLAEKSYMTWWGQDFVKDTIIEIY